MKAQVKVNKGMIVEVEAETQKDLFQAVASAYEVFGEKKCGLCGSEDIVPAWRKVSKVTGKKVETFEYPEYHCPKPGCRARLSLGANLEGGTLFPNRRLLENGKPATGEEREKGSFGPHNGWSKYKGEDRKEDGKG